MGLLETQAFPEIERNSCLLALPWTCLSIPPQTWFLCFTAPFTDPRTLSHLVGFPKSGKGCSVSRYTVTISPFPYSHYPGLTALCQPSR